MPVFFGLGPDNPVTWSNFYRRGGFKTLAGVSTPYLLIIGGLIFLGAKLNPRDSSRIYAAWSAGLMALQFVFVVIIGAGRVAATVRGDVTSGMQESLRMMPLPGRHVIAGYLASSAALLSGFFATNFVLGLIVNALSQMPAQRWLMANFLLFAFALFVWTLSAFLALVIRNAAAVLVMVSIVGLFGNELLFRVIPGLAVLCGPLIGRMFEYRSAQAELGAPVILSLAAQFLIGAIFFAAAVRKYRRPDALALGGWLSVALLLAVVGISLLAMLKPESFQPRFMFGPFDQNSPVAFCGSVIVALLVALVPLANLARLRVASIKGRRDDPQLRAGAPSLAVSGLIVMGVLGLMILALPIQTGPDTSRTFRPEAVRALGLLAALLGFCLSMTFVAAWFYRSVESAKVILIIWIACYCVAPLVLGIVGMEMSDQDDPSLGVAGAFSPIGMVIEASQDTKPAVMVPGAVFHLLAPLLPAAFYLRTGRRAAEATVPVA
jgi:hypothetical protein